MSGSSKRSERPSRGDLKRFQQLKDIPEEAPREEQSQQTSELANLIECRDKAECERMWQQALSYLRQHATVPIETAGNDVAMTQPPLSIKDIALTVSRIWNPNHSSAVIFLDLQCRSYSASADACRTEPRRDILNAFRSTLEAGEIGDIGPVQAAR